MAQVASCPQCAHDLLIPEAMDAESWAKCPECRAFFQIEQAMCREVPAVLPAEPQSAEASLEPAADETATAVMPSEPLQDMPETVIADDAGDTELAEPRSSDELHAAAARIDKWFQSAKTVPDTPPISPSETLADSEGAALDDLETGNELGSFDGDDERAAPSTWDDSQHMERLLAEIDTPPAPQPAPAEEAPPAAPRASEYADAIAGTSAADIPVFSRRTNGKPRRERSIARTMTKAALAGVVGLAVGYYALLWLKGPSGDFLNLARFLPAATLPAEMQPKPAAVAAAAPPVADEVTPPVMAASHDEQTGEDGPENAGPAEESALALDEEQSPPAVDDTQVAAVEAVSAETLPAEVAAEAGEVQTSYTTSDERDGRYGLDELDVQPLQEPAPLGEPRAMAIEEAQAPAAAEIENAPKFTAAELAAALEAAQQALPSLTAGSLTDSREVARAKGYSYSLLADLAQKAAFVDRTEDLDSLAELQPGVESLFRNALSDAHTRGEIDAIVPKWIASPHRKHGGVFFAATLSDRTDAGSVAQYRATFESGESLDVVIPAEMAGPAIETSRPLGIVGWIVDRPSENLSGYKGEAPQAVWAAGLVPLD